MQEVRQTTTHRANVHQTQMDGEEVFPTYGTMPCMK